jgi:hypothetical protein
LQAYLLQVYSAAKNTIAALLCFSGNISPEHGIILLNGLHYQVTTVIFEDTITIQTICDEKIIDLQPADCTGRV